ncbi:MAG: hypothetical protein JKX67_12515 [Colwellia sp.]|nr:hypothetical protein [Colwellia sp.]
MTNKMKEQPTELQKLLDNNKDRFTVSDKELKLAIEKAERSYKLLPRTIPCIKEKQFYYLRTFGSLLEKSEELVKLGYELDTKNSRINGVGFQLLALKPKKLIKSDLAKMHNDIESELLTIKEGEKEAFVADLMAEQKATLLQEAEIEAQKKSAALADEITALIK